jgi:phage/plasmid-like protein (TIGR03299 family)
MNSTTNNAPAYTLRVTGRYRTEYTDHMQNTTQENLDMYRGVGAAINPGLSIHQQLESAGLNWQVEISDVRYGHSFSHQSDYRKAIYRSDNGFLLDTVGGRWQPFQNRQILETFQQFCSEAGIELEHLGELRQGRTIFATAKLNEQFDLTRDDVTDGCVLLTNYHEFGAGLRVDLMTNARICTNGMTLPVRVGSKTINHVGLYNRDRILAVLEAAKTNFREFKQQTEQLANTPITLEEFTLLLIQEFGDPTKPMADQPRAVHLCLKLFNGQGRGANELSRYQTAYGALSTVTEYYNHYSPQRGGIVGHLNSLWLGNKAKRQQQFMQQLVSVCC